jgi:hypothetical protein
MRRLSFVGVCLASVLLLFRAAGTPAVASTSVPVTIQCTVIIGPFTGTWTASAGINHSGTLVQPVDFRVGQGRVVHLMRVMTGSKGPSACFEDR